VVEVGMLFSVLGMMGFPDLMLYQLSRLTKRRQKLFLDTSYGSFFEISKYKILK